jgi:hypothetical protein
VGALGVRSCACWGEEYKEDINYFVICKPRGRITYTKIKKARQH